MLIEHLGPALAVGVLLLAMAWLAWEIYKSQTGYQHNKIPREQTVAKTTGYIRIGKKYSESSRYGKGRLLAEYTEYNIEYEVNGKTYSKWFDLYPGIDFGDSLGKGTEVVIEYDVNHPDAFEVVRIEGFDMEEDF